MGLGSVHHLLQDLGFRAKVSKQGHPLGTLGIHIGTTKGLWGGGSLLRFDHEHVEQGNLYLHCRSPKTLNPTRLIVPLK